MIAIDDLDFENFKFLIENFDIDRPYVVTVNSGSVVQFLKRIKKANLSSLLEDSLYMLFHQKLVFSSLISSHIPLFHSVENSHEFQLLLNEPDYLESIKSLSDLSRKQRGDFIQPTESYLLKCVKNKVISSQQALQICENQAFLLKRLSVLQLSLIHI